MWAGEERLGEGLHEIDGSAARVGNVQGYVET